MPRPGGALDRVHLQNPGWPGSPCGAGSRCAHCLALGLAPRYSTPLLDPIAIYAMKLIGHDPSPFGLRTRSVEGRSRGWVAQARKPTLDGWSSNSPLRIVSQRELAAKSWERGPEGWGLIMKSASTLRGGGADATGGGTRPRGPCFRAHDETVAIAHGVEAPPNPVVLMDELRVSTGPAEHPG